MGQAAIANANCTDVKVEIGDFDATVTPQGYGDPVSGTVEKAITSGIVWTLEDTVKSNVEESASSLIRREILEVQGRFRSDGQGENAVSSSKDAAVEVFRTSSNPNHNHNLLRLYFAEIVLALYVFLSLRPFFLLSSFLLLALYLKFLVGPFCLRHGGK
jgi:hypothetical protein